MNRIVSFAVPVVLIVVMLPAPALATWSIVAVDQSTRRLVIASATCVPQAAFAGFPAKGLMDVQAIVVPGKGVAAAQAGVDRTRKNQQLIFDEMVKGTDPARIVLLGSVAERVAQTARIPVVVVKTPPQDAG